MAPDGDRRLRRAVPGLSRGVALAGLGGWLTLSASHDEAAAVRLLGAAVDGGIDLVDLAGCEHVDVYFCHREDPATPSGGRCMTQAPTACPALVEPAA